MTNNVSHNDNVINWLTSTDLKHLNIFHIWTCAVLLDLTNIQVSNFILTALLTNLNPEQEHETLRKDYLRMTQIHSIKSYLISQAKPFYYNLSISIACDRSFISSTLLLFYIMHWSVLWNEVCETSRDGEVEGDPAKSGRKRDIRSTTWVIKLRAKERKWARCYCCYSSTAVLPAGFIRESLSFLYLTLELLYWDT